MNKTQAQTLAERIKYCHTRITAYRHILETYDRSKKEIADQRAILDKQERLLDAALKEAPNVISRSERELAQLGILKAQHEFKGIPIMRKGKISKLLDKRQKLLEKLKALEQQIVEIESPDGATLE